MKTSEIFKTVLFLAGIIMLTESCNKKDDKATVDFEMTVPADWTYLVYGGEGLVYYAASPVKSSHDSITEDLEVTNYATNNPDLHAFYTSYVTELAKDTSYHQLSVTDTTINGEEAVKLTHLMNLLAVNLARHDTIVLDSKMQKYIMMNRNHGYVISFNALRETFNEYHPIFDNIIATFNFKQ